MKMIFQKETKKYHKKKLKILNCWRRASILRKLQNNSLLKNYQKWKHLKLILFKWNQMLTQKIWRYQLHLNQLVRKHQVLPKNRNRHRQNNPIIKSLPKHKIQLPKTLIKHQKYLKNPKRNLQIKVLLLNRKASLYEVDNDLCFNQLF